MIKTYSEMILLPTINERLEYLSLGGSVGSETFGYDRYVNQALYTSKEWRRFRNSIIVRDFGCDLAMEGFEIEGKIIIHHINPLTLDDIINRSSVVFARDNVVCVSHALHQAIHYGTEMPYKDYKPRQANDTCPWK